MQPADAPGPPSAAAVEALYTPPPLELAPMRPPRKSWRLLKAYWVTFVVLASYLSLKLQARFRSQAAIDRLLARKHMRNARRIERAIIALQGLFIKIGQLISIMTNFLPAEFRRQLEGLQDQVPPRPYKDIEARIHEEFAGKGPRELFAEFDERPIAAASIGQVHMARLHDGRRVAVKVQYPDIEETSRLDLRALKRIFAIVSHFIPFQGLDGVYREIRAMIEQELDFKIEEDNTRRIAANFAGRPEVGFPEPIAELTTGRVITTTWQSGVKVNDVERLRALGVDRTALARAVVEAYCQQIFIDGIYHADPHPGNILARACAGSDKPCIVFLDFGAVAEVSPPMRQGIIELIQGALHRDSPRIVSAMRQMGFIARGADPRVFDGVIDFFHQRFQEEIHLESFSLREIKFDPDRMLENLADLRKMNISLRELSSSFFVPKEWILLERTVLLLMGLCTALDPELSPMSVIRPYLERFVLGPDHDWSNLVVSTTKDLAVSAIALPGEIRKFMGAVQRGALEVSSPNVDQAAHLIYRLGHQIIYTALGIAATVVAENLRDRGDLGHARWAWYVAGGAGVLLLGSFWSTRSWLRRKRRR